MGKQVLSKRLWMHVDAIQKLKCTMHSSSQKDSKSCLKWTPHQSQTSWPRGKPTSIHFNAGTWLCLPAGAPDPTGTTLPWVGGWKTSSKNGSSGSMFVRQLGLLSYFRLWMLIEIYRKPMFRQLIPDDTWQQCSYCYLERLHTIANISSIYSPSKNNWLTGWCLHCTPEKMIRHCGSPPGWQNMAN